MSQEKDSEFYVCTLDELRDQKIISKQIKGKRISVAEVEGQVFAFEDGCPHQGESLAKGRLQGFFITCPAHNWKFDLRTGDSPVIPDEFIYTFKTKTAEDGIFVVV